MITIGDILTGTRGELVLPQDPSTIPDIISSVAIDSRKCEPGSLFVAIRGEHQDGHRFVSNAVAQGAAGVIVERGFSLDGVETRPEFMVVVPDTSAALQNLAHYWRMRHAVDVVGITGSMGKTSAKELAAAVLATSYKVLKSEGNLNTDFGLALALLKLTAEHEVAVLEMGGAYRLGEIADLCTLAEPRIGAVTTVAPVHLELMGTIEAIAENKSELVQAIPPDGVAILNADNEYVREMASKSRGEVVFFGRSDDAHLRAFDIEGLGLDGFRFSMRWRDEVARVRMPLLGKHNIYTALPAAAIALVKGVSLSDVVASLERAELPGRLTVRKGISGSLIIDDTYNANPDSVCAALDILAEVDGRRIAVLGDMYELGSYEYEGHCRVGDHAAEIVDYLIVVGQKTTDSGKSALAAGMPKERVIFAGSKREAAEKLSVLLKGGGVALVKGSRGMAMEEIVREVTAAN